ncbi:MAG TPA: ergothioneine biosynthesis protein EgtB [Burkholderiaceae bacterium]|nr:ergothioneine biosynthesis protein EgtB [Burkholderiaceae bacterium]
MHDTDLRLVERYLAVRRRSAALCAPLAIEDHVPQPIIDASPPKWHLGHVTWFFEAMLLQPHLPGYRVFHPRWAYVFNSYYESMGERVLRMRRGDLGRPTVAEVLAYREHVDAAMRRLLESPLDAPLAALVELGLQHEQQHQELLVTDIKAILGLNPLEPAYDPGRVGPLDAAAEHRPAPGSPDAWLRWPGGTTEIGHDGDGFAFDNESPRHAVAVGPFELRAAPVTNAEWLAFMADGGYERFEFWHAEGWDWVRTLERRAPMYWRPDPDRPGGWLHYALDGTAPVPQSAPVTHVSFYEAAAFCRWAGWRLPTEPEWEALAPRIEPGARWEWTNSAYLPYPGFRPARGPVGEYNGKFMVGQHVLRGASFATPPGHARRTYRNFFHPPLRWQYTGVRPARDLETA